MPATLKTIAVEAGVSIMAVSSVLNNKAITRVSEITRERILSIARKQDYQPNASARALVRKRTELIGCIIRDSVESSFWPAILAGIDKTLSASGMHMILTVTSSDLKAEREAMRFLRSKGVDACIWSPVITQNGHDNFEEFREYAHEFPLVMLNYNKEGFHGVAVDEIEGGSIAADYLHARGHTVVAAIGKNHIYRRTDYFLERAGELGMKTFVYPFPEKAFTQRKKFTAAFCSSDMQALELYGLCQKTGIKIPDELSIIGYNNLLLCEILMPKLTTIHQPKEEIGVSCARRILQLLDNPALPPEQIFLSPVLCERDSVALHHPSAVLSHSLPERKNSNRI